MRLENNPWLIFIKERFPPASYIPMTILFVLANCAMAAKAMNVHLHAGKIILAFLLALSFFFRLRLFDEIKDYDTDLKVNPSRPLARGLLTLVQVKAVAFGLIAFELILATIMGLNPLLSHAIAVGYSLLMYNEFFIGPWLAPHLTTYAVTHTFVSALLGFSLGSFTTHTSLFGFPSYYYLMGLVNWTLFNLFEFSRKTFVPFEERKNVDSYSSLFGIWGAVGLSLSQAVLAGFFAHLLLKGPWLPWVALIFILTASGLYLCISKLVQSARAFRTLSGLFLFIFFLVFYLNT